MKKIYIAKMDTKRLTNIFGLLNKEKFTIALREIKDYMEDYPMDDLGLLTYAKCLLKMADKGLGATENYQEIEAICLEVINRESKFKGNAWVLLGKLELRKKDFKSVDTCFQNAISCRNAMSKHLLISTLIRVGKNQEALDVIETPGTTGNFPDMILSQKATVLHNLGRDKEAFHIVNDIDTSNFSESQKDYYMALKAKIYMENNRFLEAEKMMLEQVRKSSYYNESQIILLQCYVKEKKVVEAFQLGNKLKKSSKAYYREYAECYLARIYELVGNRDKARDVYLTILKNSDNYSRETIQVAYHHLGKLELCDRNYLQAKEYFEKMDDSIEKNIAKKKLYLAIAYMKLGNFVEADSLLESIKEDSYFEDDITIYYQMKEMIKFSKGVPIKGNNYFAKQLVHYRKDLLLNHIDRVHENWNTKAVFRKDINLNHLVDKVRLLIDNSTMIENTSIEKYLIPYKNVGYCNGKLTDYMEVVIIAGTNHILTMYPVNYISEEELQKEPNRVYQKRKTPSQIDKFNAKYRLKG